jgi:hypothetical protein
LITFIVLFFIGGEKVNRMIKLQLSELEGKKIQKYVSDNGYKLATLVKVLLLQKINGGK